MDEINSKYNFIDEYIGETKEERANNLAEIVIEHINHCIEDGREIA